MSGPSCKTYLRHCILFEPLSFFMHMKYVKRVEYLSEEVLWVSVGQLAAKLQAVKVGGVKKILPRSMSRGDPGSTPG